MHSYNHLWQHMVNQDNVKRRYRDASKHKTKRRDVKNALAHVDARAATLTERLENGTWIPPVHKPSYLREGSNGKIRTIIKPTYTEQMVHHLLVGELQPIIMRGMYRYCCGSVPGRGTHYAKKAFEKWRNEYRGKKYYVAELDIRKFYENVDHDLLKAKLQRVIRDKRFLGLLFTVIDTGGKGLPLGFYTSQWLANFFLQDLDNYILQQLKPDHYLRYMDNLYIYGRNKKELHASVRSIEMFLRTLLLALNSNWQVYRAEHKTKTGAVRGRAVNALGFVVHHNRTTVRKTILKRARRNANKIGRKKTATWYDACSAISYVGYFDHSDTYGYFQDWIKPNVNVRAMKKLISRHARKECAA